MGTALCFGLLRQNRDHDGIGAFSTVLAAALQSFMLDASGDASLFELLDFLQGCANAGLVVFPDSANAEYMVFNVQANQEITLVRKQDRIEVYLHLLFPPFK